MAYPIATAARTRTLPRRSDLLLDPADVPARYKSGSAVWSQPLADAVCSTGLSKFRMVPKAGVSALDASDALWQVKRIIDGVTASREFDAAVIRDRLAYFLDEWFDGTTSTWTAVR